MRNDDTIAAIASPAGASPLGIVRTSGPRAFDAAAAALVPRPGARPPDRRLFAGRLEIGGDASLEASLLFFAGPRSATGEDVAEIRTVGSPPVLREVLRGCLRRGARLAEPGEFTRRAFLRGRIDLLQAEAVADLIEAETAAEAARAAPSLRGDLGARIERVKDALLDAAALLEARLDFADEDVPALDPAEVASPIERAREEIGRLLASPAQRLVPGDEPLVALAGAPNAGKSTLFNALLGRDRSIASGVAGTTRDAVLAPTDRLGRRVLLADGAGLSSSPAERGEVESAARRKALDTIGAARLVLLLVDLSCEPAPDAEESIRDAISAATGAVLVVGTKSDLRPSAAGRALFERHARGPGLAISARRGDGLGDLVAAMGRAIDADASGAAASPSGVVSERRREALRAARRSLARARLHVRRGIAEPELLAADVREAAEALGRLTGTVGVDDVLDRVFARFCIGK